MTFDFSRKRVSLHARSPVNSDRRLHEGAGCIDPCDCGTDCARGRSSCGGHISPRRTGSSPSRSTTCSRKREKRPTPTSAWGPISPSSSGPTARNRPRANGASSGDRNARSRSRHEPVQSALGLALHPDAGRQRQLPAQDPDSGIVYLFDAATGLLSSTTTPGGQATVNTIVSGRSRKPRDPSPTPKAA